MVPLLYDIVVFAVVTIAAELTNLNPVRVVFSDEFCAFVTVTLKKSVKVVLFSVNVPFEPIVPLGEPLPLIETTLFEALIFHVAAVALVLLKETVMLAPVVVLSAAIIPVALVELSVTFMPSAAVPPPAC